MANSEITLELETEAGTRSTRAQRIEAVRVAKENFIQFFLRTDYSDSIHIAGQNLSFPLLVLSGPKEQIDSLLEHADKQFPGMIRKIDRGGMVKLVE